MRKLRLYLYTLFGLAGIHQISSAIYILYRLVSDSFGLEDVSYSMGWLFWSSIVVRIISGIGCMHLAQLYYRRRIFRYE